MSARSAVFAVLPALCAGLFAGYLLASLVEPPHAPDSSRGVRPAPARVVAAAAPAPAELAPASALELDAPASDARTAAETERPARAARVPQSELSRALERVAAPSLEPRGGRGAITGRVVGPQGEPLAGAVVIAHARTPGDLSDPSEVGPPPPEDQGLEDYLRERAQDWAEARAGRRRARSGADGAFTLDGLDPDATYRVEAYLADHVLSCDVSTHSVSPGRSLLFRAQPVHRLKVELVHPDGARARSGVVSVRRADETTRYRWSADHPELRLRPGYVVVRGFADAGSSEGWSGLESTHASEERRIDPALQGDRPLVLELEARGGIRGRIVDPLGGGRGHRTVRLLPLHGDAAVDEKALASSDLQAEVSGDRYRVLDLSPGTYAVGLASWDGTVFTHATAVVEHEVVDLDLVVPEAGAESFLVVRATDPSGRAADGVDFHWMSRSGGGSRSGGLQAERRGADGSYWLRPRPEYFEPWPTDAKYVLTLQHAVLGSRTVELEEGQREVDVAFEEPASLLVVVRGYVQSGYEGRIDVGVRSRSEDGGRSSWSGPRSRGLDAEGRLRVDGLAPGDYTIALSMRSEGWQVNEIASVDARVESGEERVEIALPRLYTLRVSAPGLSPNAWLQLRSAAGADDEDFMGGVRMARLDAERRAEFAGLVAGDYLLSGSGFEAIEVTVPCGELHLDAREPRCLRVAIGDQEGALYRAGLRAGDLVVGADGKEFESVGQAYGAVFGQGDVRLLVQRGASRLEIAAQRFTSSRNALGGALTPAARP